MNFIDLNKLVENFKIIKNKDVIVWGTGGMGKMIESILPIDVKYYIDSNEEKVGSKINNISICHYKKLKDEQKGNFVVIISSSANGAFLEIKNLMVNMGLEENIDFINGNIFYELYLCSQDKEYDKLFRKYYWESRVKDLTEHNKKYTNEYPMIIDIMKLYKPNKVLEIGIGSGRFLHIYKNNNIINVVGQDIAEQALEICKRNFPEYIFTNKEIYKLEFDTNEFDVCIANRVLSAIPKELINNVLDILCKISKAIMLNEYTQNEYIGDSSYWLLHQELVDKVIDRGFHIKKEYLLDYDGNMETNGVTKAYLLEKNAF